MHRSMKQNSQETKPHNYGELTYCKGRKYIQCKKTVSSTSGAGKTGQLHVKE